MTEKQETKIMFAVMFGPIVSLSVFLLFFEKYMEWFMWGFGAVAVVVTMYVMYVLLCVDGWNEDGRMVPALFSVQMWRGIVDWFQREKKEKVDPKALLHGEGWQDIVEGVNVMIPERKTKKYKPIKRMWLPSMDGKGLYARDKDGKPIPFGVRVEGKHYSNYDESTI